MSTLQTLDRGLRALDIIAASQSGLTVSDLAAELDVHRAICYRIVATLEEHALVVRRPDGRLGLGAGIAVLASRFAPQFQVGARAVLTELAEATHATAHVSTAHGDECLVTMVAEPMSAMFHVGYRVGVRHPLSRGAAGAAILALRPPAAGDSEQVKSARSTGFSVSRGELEAGAVGVAAGVALPDDVRSADGLEFSIGVVALNDIDVERSATAVVQAARRLSEMMRSG